MRQGETATQEELLWSRGLMPDPLHGHQWGMGSDVVHKEGEGHELAGQVAVDGSLQSAQFKALRVGGWAAVCKTAAGGMLCFY